MKRKNKVPAKIFIKHDEEVDPEKYKELTPLSLPPECPVAKPEPIIEPEKNSPTIIPPEIVPEPEYINELNEEKKNS